MKSDNISRTLAMMEDELKRTEERVVLAETRVVDVEAGLQNIGENQKQLEVSEEKARQREEKYQVNILLDVDVVFLRIFVVRRNKSR